MGKEENPLVTKTPGPSPGRIRTHLYDMHRLEACLHLASYQLTMDYVSILSRSARATAHDEEPP
jgi:hypothetical protein